MHGQSSFVVDDYRVIEQIGQGVFSIVYKAEHIRTKAIVALKEIRKEISARDQLLVENEIDILRSCQHPNIITLLRDFRFKGKKYLAFEYCSRGDLNKLLREQGNGFEYLGTFQQTTTQMITSCICSALSELHRKNTVHRDLKLANILLTEDFVVKLADFGFSKQSEEELMKTYCGTPITMPPEILDHQNYKKENCDTWSLGVICYQMLYGQPPWMPEEIGLVSLMNCIRQKPLRFNEHVQVSDQCKRFLMRCLDKNMNTRPTIRELMADPWLAEGERQLKLKGNAFAHEQQLLENFELPEIVSQTSLQAANSQQWAIYDIFKLTTEQAFTREIHRLQMVNPKVTMKRLEELFADETVQLVVPLLWVQRMRKLSSISIYIGLPEKSFELPISKCKELGNMQKTILSGIKKFIDLEKIESMKINLESSLYQSVYRLLIDTLTAVQPIEIIQEKLDALLGLVELLQPKPSVLKVGITVSKTLDDYEQEQFTSQLHYVTKEQILEKINDGAKKKQTEESLNRKFNCSYLSSPGGTDEQQKEFESLKYIIAENLKVYRRSSKTN